MTLLLYDNALSGNCHKARLLLGMLGIEYERREVSVVERSGRGKVLGGLSPSLTVPTLVLDDGRPLAESNAILWYFADGTPFLPDDPYERAQVLQWMFFEQYKHEPGLAVVRYLVSIADEIPPGAEIEVRRASGYSALKAMEHHLAEHEYFVGERFTIADLALYPYTQAAPEGDFDLDPFPAVRSWLERVEAAPGVAPMAAL